MSAEYAHRGVRVPASHIVLTASSSESYALLFKLLCDPGESVLVPTPSYPLFEHLTRLDCVHALPYRTEYHGTWTIDLDDLRYAIDETTRAILVVSPNNPTGQWLKREELAALVDVCAAHHLALIGDEVFADYPIDPAPGAVRSVLDQGGRVDGQPWRVVQVGGPAAAEARVDGAAGTGRAAAVRVDAAGDRLGRVSFGGNARAGRRCRPARRPGTTSGFRFDSASCSNYRHLLEAVGRHPVLPGASRGRRVVGRDAHPAHDARGRMRHSPARAAAPARAPGLLLRLSPRRLSGREPAHHVPMCSAAPYIVC